MPAPFMSTPNASDYDELEEAVIAYLSECDNPVHDYLHRRALRDHLRKLVGASPEPERR